MWIHPVAKSHALGIAFAALFSHPVHAENFGRGQELFEHQCHACHGDPYLGGKESKIKSLSELRNRITSWAIHTGTEWGNTEVDDVLLYMNKSFYHFKEDEF